MPEEEYSTLSIKLPTAFIDHLDELRTEWGLETKGAVTEKILEAVFNDAEEENHFNYEPWGLSAICLKGT